MDKDPAKAKELYQKAIDAGELAGYSSMARLYEKGEGVEVNAAKAVELFSQDAEGGAGQSALAMCALGACAANGTGLEQSDDVAADWYRKALDAAGPSDDYAVEFATERLGQ